ncbi:multidrug ABC transporter ATP-binding protein [Listeria ivanovii]|uniref:ATP-binding cassette domain-containing protein n=1 Tax=Listeria ivanovii TaxID=1638 RepID=UPI000DAAD0B4|nr:ABC transporter ATP-binding protein [Listeria ivanovii]PZG40786.1 multidrug ABC transporter ATP-binding protein [Listeria ivanovii]
MSDTIIECINVSKEFKHIQLFTDVNITFTEGKCYGIKGHNGSGKSIFFKMLCQFLTPTTGEIRINSRFLNKKDNYPSDFGIIIDKPGYIANKTGLENLMELADINKKVSIDIVKETMKRVGIDPDIKQKMKNYSLGMRQKIAITQAIMEDQKVILLDEPFNGLDSSSVENIRNLIKELKKEQKTIIIISHNQEDLDILCDEVYQIDNKQIKHM